jgi:hypothetical protein
LFAWPRWYTEYAATAADRSVKNKLEAMLSISRRTAVEAKAATDPRRRSLGFVDLVQSRENAP